MRTGIAGLLAVLVTTSSGPAADAATPRCPPPQDRGYRPRPTAAGHKAKPLPRLMAWVIRDCLVEQTSAAGPVERRLSVSPIIRFDKAGRAPPGAESRTKTR